MSKPLNCHSAEGRVLPPQWQQKQFEHENEKRFEEWREEHLMREQELSEMVTTYDVLLFYPHETASDRSVEVDAECFELIEAWPSLPGYIKTALVSMIRRVPDGGWPDENPLTASVHGNSVPSETDSQDVSTTDPQPSRDSGSAKGDGVAGSDSFSLNVSTQSKAKEYQGKVRNGL